MSLLYYKMDEVAIRKALEDAVAFSPEVQAKANKVVAGLFGRAKDNLMRDFNENPITQELKAGSEASNISDTLNGEGNLFGFLGFFQGQDPTEELGELLSRVSYERSSIRKNVIYYKITNYPTEGQIKDATRMNWGNGASWAYGVETGEFEGDASLSHYIFKTWAGSRSQAGFQIKGYEYSEESFNPKPYITQILENFADRVNNSTSKFLI